MMMNTPAFHAFDSQHFVTLGIIASACLLVGWKARSGKPRKIIGWVLGFVLLSYAAVLYSELALEGSLSLQYSLPLELCNLVLIACIFSLFRPNQFATEIAYFGGLGGVLQATLTPELSRGFPSWDFVFFFWSHGATLVAIIFLASGRGFRPRRKSVLRMMAALNVYGLVVGTLDAAMGWNYGYLCQKPADPSLLDFLGPWPWYLFSLELIALIIFLLLGLPWILRKDGNALLENESLKKAESQ